MALLNPPLDDETLRLLDGAQRGFPLVEQPFAVVAQRLGTTEAALLDALSRSHEAGALSRLGPVFKPNTVGASTLAALAAPAERLDEVATIVSLTASAACSAATTTTMPMPQLKTRYIS